MKRYQIFISSTYMDLVEERASVVESILKLRHIPVGMEHFVAANEEQFQHIKGLIDETDYFVLILGNRYGSVASDGVGYTEKEFDYAVKIGVPILAFVHSSPDSLPVNKSEKTESARKKLQRFRDKVQNNRLVSRFSWESPSSLSKEVVVALTNVVSDCPRPGWERVGGTHPNLIEEDKIAINQKLLKILNYTLGENTAAKLSKRPLSLHKSNPDAQESKLSHGDSIEIMTNTLTYDINEESLCMVARNLSKSVQYHYFLENNASVMNCVGKFINGISVALDKLALRAEKKTILSDNLHIFLLQENNYPYSFALINRPKIVFPDHGSLYFIMREGDERYIYEVLIEPDNGLIGDLKAVFRSFSEKTPKLNVLDYLN